MQGWKADAAMELYASLQSGSEGEAGRRGTIMKWDVEQNPLFSSLDLPGPQAILCSHS